MEDLLDQLENIGGLEMFGPEGLTLLLALWRKSMKLAWARTFVMTNTELIYKAGFKNRESLNNVRHKVSQAGLFHYKPPSRGKSEGIYTLEFDLVSAIQKRVVKEPVSVADNFPDNFPDRFADNFTDNLPDNFPDTNVSKLVSKLEGKLNARARESIPDAWETIRQEFEQTFCTTMKQSHFEMIGSYLDEGMEIELILLALEDARNNQAEYPKYLWRILDAWTVRNIKTIADYRRDLQAQANNKPETGEQKPLFRPKQKKVKSEYLDKLRKAGLK
ncbi:DnaD domain protein [Effusibacillus consociatus]|uniref:DnaD domain protein n=1 Tax=Effusibacillus consociatus TaxID=1117041 RepID=A0ABV9Q3G6_9BACL